MAELTTAAAPQYTIMATHARPAPHDPYNPSASAAIAHPSPHVPIRVPVFAPVIAIDDAVLRAVDFCLRRRTTAERRPERAWGAGAEEGAGEQMKRAGPRLRQGGRKKVD
jgi:hypothetical protein